MSIEKRRYNVLCLSGGGYRGLFTAALLRNIQRGYNLDSVGRHFDLIIGTSTGGLVATALACGLAPDDIVSGFERYGREIFPSQSWLRRTYSQLAFRPQYDPRRTSAAVHAMLGDKAVLDIESLDAPLALVAVSTVEQRHKVFCGKPFADPGTAPTQIVEAVLATTAAPTYFPEHNTALDCLIDGGLAANAPVLLAISMLRVKRTLPAEKIHVLHIGTAAPAKAQSFDEPKMHRYGPRGWSHRALKTTRDLVLLTLSAQEALATDIARAWIGDNYVYVDAPDRYRQDEELERLDNSSAAATKKLKKLAEQTWREWQGEPTLRSFFDASVPIVVPSSLPAGNSMPPPRGTAVGSSPPLGGSLHSTPLMREQSPAPRHAEAFGLLKPRG